MKTQKLVVATFRIHDYKRGYREVPGWTVGPLGIHEKCFGDFRITHLMSGCAFPSPCDLDSLRKAARFARLLIAAGGDTWLLPCAFGEVPSRRTKFDRQGRAAFIAVRDRVNAKGFRW